MAGAGSPAIRGCPDGGDPLVYQVDHDDPEQALSERGPLSGFLKQLLTPDEA